MYVNICYLRPVVVVAVPLAEVVPEDELRGVAVVLLLRLEEEDTVVLLVPVDVGEALRVEVELVRFVVVSLPEGEVVRMLVVDEPEVRTLLFTVVDTERGVEEVAVVVAALRLADDDVLPVAVTVLGEEPLVTVAVEVLLLPVVLLVAVTVLGVDDVEVEAERTVVPVLVDELARAFAVEAALLVVGVEVRTLPAS